MEHGKFSGIKDWSGIVVFIFIVITTIFPENIGTLIFGTYDTRSFCFLGMGVGAFTVYTFFGLLFLQYTMVICCQFNLLASQHYEILNKLITTQ